MREELNGTFMSLSADIAGPHGEQASQTAASAGPERCVHRLVEAQTACHPDATAVLTTDGRHSYAELNRRANQLAHYLTDRLKVAPGDLIAVAAERSFELVVFALAVLKAGAAYVPLDPAYPAARQAQVLDDARPAAVLTIGRHRAALPDTAPPVLCVDTIAELLSRCSGENPGRPCEPDSLLCVIYTSGTTGRPKGVMLPHRGVSNSLRWEQAAYEITAADRMLQLASWSFSLAIIETFSPLCAGAAVVMAPAGAGGDASMISRLVAEYGITLLSVVPAELKLLLDQEPGLPWATLRRVITGADRLPRALVEQYFRTCPAVPLVNVYGQTESSMDGLWWTCQPDEDSERVPVGRPISNARAYILDGDMRPVPVGVTGVLHCGGEGLSRGYLGRPGLTAERFVPDPFGSVPGGRLCRSGDFARWRPDGAVELLGREDHQVQIGGTRLELEEIESVLCEHPGVRDAAAAMRAAPEAPLPGRADPLAWSRLLVQLDPATVERHLASAERAAAARA
jgi:amino acid adenylation domain-containing protein